MQLPLQHQDKNEMGVHYLNCLIHQNDMFYQALKLKMEIEHYLKRILDYSLIRNICVLHQPYLQL